MNLHEVPNNVVHEICLLLGLTQLPEVKLYCTIPNAVIFSIGCFHYVCDDNISSNAYWIEFDDYAKNSEAMLPDPDMQQCGKILADKLQQGIAIRMPLFFGPFSRVLDFWPEGRRFHDKLVDEYKGEPILLFVPADTNIGDMRPNLDDSFTISKEHAYRKMLFLTDVYAQLEHDVCHR